MLKLVKTSALIVVASMAVANTAQASIDTALQNICTIVKTDDKSELRKKMKMVQTDFHMKLKDYYSGVTCDGNSLIRTAMLSNAVETGTLLVKKMPKKDLTTPEQDGKTLQAWASENGLEASPIATVLSERI